METVEALRKSPLLASLGEEQMAGLAGMARQRTFAAGDTLIKEGDSRAAAMYVIIDGTVEIKKGDTVVAERHAGDAVGELALVAPTARTADVVARTETTVVALARWDFVPYVRANPDVAMAVIEELAARIDEANQRMAGN